MSSNKVYTAPLRAPKLNIAQAEAAKAEGLHLALAQMGYPGLREVQRAPVENILHGRDIFVVAPTSAGKSAMFVVPTLALGWRTLVFSPLVALMRDQVVELQRRGVAASFVNSHQTDAANEATLQTWAQGKIQVLYVAPERIQNSNFVSAMRERSPDMVTVDEAHCLWQWADTFRSAYYKIGEFCAEYNPKVVSAFTATCTEEIEEDVCRVLGIPHNCTLWQYYKRDNLSLCSRELFSDHEILRDIQEIEGKIVIYFSTIKRLMDFADWVKPKLQDGDEVGVYHGDLTPDVRSYLQDSFKNGNHRVMLATNAFGLGVNVEDIRAVIHHDPPGTPEALSQELGRAGRDERASQCITYFHNDGWRTQRRFIDSAHPDEQEIRAVYATLRKLGLGGTVIKRTGEEIADMAKVNKYGMRAIMQILYGAGCVDDVKSDDRIAKIRYKGSAEDERFRKYHDLVVKYGALNAGGTYEVNLDILRQQLGVQEGAVTTWFRRWNTEGFIEFEPPFKGKPKVVIGDITRVDFARLAERKAQAWEKFAQVQAYMEVPDSSKHQWLADYFAKWR